MSTKTGLPQLGSGDRDPLGNRAPDRHGDGLPAQPRSGILRRCDSRTHTRRTAPPPATLTELPRSGDDFAQILAYAEASFPTREAFLAETEAPWHAEFQAMLRSFLRKDRSVLSIGSGLGEHEVPLVLAGYDIVATDIVDSLAEATRLFPELRVRRFDILDPDTSERYDDVLVAALDYALDDEQLALALNNAARVLNPGGRVLLVVRYRDTFATRMLDIVLLPLWAARRRRRGADLVKRKQGFRRSLREVRRIGQRSGYTVGRIGYAGHAVELTRLGVDIKLPRVYALARRLDRRLHKLNIATMVELVANS